MSIEKRIENLERTTGAGQQKDVWLVAVYDDTGKPSEAALEAAKAEYKAKHPDWQERDMNRIYVIWVKNEHTKELIEHIGDRFNSDREDVSNDTKKANR